MSEQSEDEQQQSPKGASIKEIDLEAVLIEMAGLNEVAGRLKPKSRWHRLREWAPILANIVALIGVGFAVGNSNLALSQSIRASTQADERARFEAVSGGDTTLISSPEVVPYFLHGVPVPADADPKFRNLIEEVAVQRVDLDAYVYDAVVRLGIAPDNGTFVLRSSPDATTTIDEWLAWSESITADFRRSPAMCTAVEDMYQSYSAQFIAALAKTKICPGLKEFPRNGRGTS